MTDPGPAATQDAYCIRGGQSLKQFFNQRSLVKEAAYIVPYLDGLPANFTFVEFGCGGGSITVDVARHYPSATVLGFDVDAGDIGTAKGLAKDAGLTNVSFGVGNALDIDSVASQPGFEALRGGCDFAHEHMVLMHVPAPQTMVAQMRSTLKPGGYMACRSHDPSINAAYPSSPALIVYIQLQGTLIAGKGADPQTAQKLVHYALRAGFKRSEITATLGDYTLSTDAARHAFAQTLNRSWVEREMVQSMLQSAGVDKDPDGVRRAWLEWADCEDGWYIMPSPQVVCRKT